MSPLRDRDAILRRVDLETLADHLLGARPGRSRMWRCPNPGHEQTGRTPPLSVFVGRTGTADSVTEALDLLDDDRHRLPAPQVVPSRPRTAADIDPHVRQELETYTAGCVEHLHSPAGKQVLAWLTEQRAIPLDVIIEARLGADPGPRHLHRPDGVPRVFPAVTFPVLNSGGEVIYTLSRHLQPSATRWWNTAERAAPNPRLAFYGPPGSGPIVVTEGPMDALSARAAGYRAVAVLGAGNVDAAIANRLTAERRRLVLAFDNDDEGRRATTRLGTLLGERGITWSRLRIPARHDDLNTWHVACSTSWHLIAGECVAETSRHASLPSQSVM